MKKTINELQLRQIVAESVKRVLKEGQYDDYDGLDYSNIHGTKGFLYATNDDDARHETTYQQSNEELESFNKTLNEICKLLYNGLCGVCDIAKAYAHNGEKNLLTIYQEADKVLDDINKVSYRMDLYLHPNHYSNDDY